MNLSPILVQVQIDARREKVWDAYTNPAHIINWNFAHPSWHCPTASNDVRVGGRYLARMEARDGSSGFNFDATYTQVKDGEQFTYEFGGRFATVTFEEIDEKTHVSITFDPETENPVDFQKQGWQAILENFKMYVENT